MSLEEEPAGPFNKAQRLSEPRLYIEPGWYLQGAGQLYCFRQGALAGRARDRMALVLVAQNDPV
jgi:hypothetical protein